MSANKKFIVWDWNGTVIHDMDAAHQAANEVLVFTQRPPIELGVWQEAFDMPLTKFYANLGYTADYLAQNIQEMTSVFHSHFETKSETAPLRQSWIESVSAAGQRAFDNIILSNHLVPSIRYHAARLGVVDHFDYILANSDQAEQLQKIPKSERLRQHIAENDLSPRNGIIIGDTPEEAHIGKQLGIASVLISGGYASQQRLDAAQPDYIIHKFDELLPLLRERGFIQ